MTKFISPRINLLSTSFTFVWLFLPLVVNANNEGNQLTLHNAELFHEELLARVANPIPFTTSAQNVTIAQNELSPVRNLLEVGIDRCGNWEKVGSDIEGSSPFDYAGTAVSMSGEGDIVAVGAPFHDGNGPNSGQVRVFKKIDNSWQKMGENMLGDNAGDNFGSSLALSRDGRTIAIGAPGNARKAGFVRVFKWNFTLKVWYKVGSDLNGDHAYSEVGSSLAISQSGAAIIIGSKGNGISSFGYSRVYQYSGLSNDWERLGGDIGEEITGENVEGVSVDLNWNARYIAIGARANKRNGEKSGYTRVFQLATSDQWVQVGNSIYGDSAFDYSGASISLNGDGDIIAIGANGSKNDTGHTRVYKYVAESNKWEKLGQDLPGDEINGFSGSSISLTFDGKALAIGAYGSGRMRGSAKLYTFFGSSWRQVGLNLSGETNYDYSGASVSFSKSGDRIAIGSPFHNGVKGDYSGQAQIFELDAVPCPPSSSPSNSPTIAPSDKPSQSPSTQPSQKPSSSPTTSPSHTPSKVPTGKPSSSPSDVPSHKPSPLPTGLPSQEPSIPPSVRPSENPSHIPSLLPTVLPSNHPSPSPSTIPSGSPSRSPTYYPSSEPSFDPTLNPSGGPSDEPSVLPTTSRKPSNFPSQFPSSVPTLHPSDSPTFTPSNIPTVRPSTSVRPSIAPTTSSIPSHAPSILPSAKPTKVPSATPSLSALPSFNPTIEPTSVPTSIPTLSSVPSLQPSNSPSVPKCPCKILALESISTGGYDGLTDFSLEIKAYARMIGMEVGDGQKQLIFPDKEFSIDGKENFVRLDEQMTTNIVDARDVDNNPVKRPFLTKNGFAQQTDFCAVDDDLCLAEIKQYSFSGDILTTLRLEIVEIDAEWWNPDDIIVKDFSADSWFSDTCDNYFHAFNLDDDKMKMIFNVISSACPSESIFR